MDKIAIATAAGKGFAVMAYILFERWLGRTEKVKASNTVDLVISGLLAILERIRKKKPEPLKEGTDHE